jgi:hypothetical protein
MGAVAPQMRGSPPLRRFTFANNEEVTVVVIYLIADFIRPKKD